MRYDQIIENYWSGLLKVLHRPGLSQWQFETFFSEIKIANSITPHQGFSPLAKQFLVAPALSFVPCSSIPGPYHQVPVSLLPPPVWQPKGSVTPGWESVLENDHNNHHKLLDQNLYIEILGKQWEIMAILKFGVLFHEHCLVPGARDGLSSSIWVAWASQMSDWCITEHSIYFCVWGCRKF